MNMRPTTSLTPIDEVIERFAAGEMLVVVDDEDRENEGDLIVAAEHATAENIGFMIRHSSGVVCVPMLGHDLDRLELPAMVADNQDAKQTAYAITCDAAEGVTTGISAADRALTIRALAAPDAKPSDFTRPGHVLPLRYAAGGVRRRPGHTEATVDLARLAGCAPAGAIAEIVHDDGSLQRFDDLVAFSRTHGLAMTSIEELVNHLDSVEPRTTHAGPVTVIPTDLGTWQVQLFADDRAGVEAILLTMGEPTRDEPVLARLHSECFTGDVLGSRRCDCQAQLQDAMTQIADAHCGAIVYLRGHEGRGIGLERKLEAYHLQDDGADTVEANLELGLPVDSRDFSIAAAALTARGFDRVRLLTNNPAKIEALREWGISVARAPSLSGYRPDNDRYLETKASRLGHLIDLTRLRRGADAIEDAPSREGIAGPRTA